MKASKALASNVFNNIYGQQGIPGGIETQSYNSFLTLYAISLAHSFPSNAVRGLKSADFSALKDISDFSAVCSDIALNTWIQKTKSIGGVGATSAVRKTRSVGAVTRPTLVRRPRMVKAAQTA